MACLRRLWKKTYKDEKDEWISAAQQHSDDGNIVITRLIELSRVRINKISITHSVSECGMKIQTIKIDP